VASCPGTGAVATGGADAVGGGGVGWVIGAGVVGGGGSLLQAATTTRATATRTLRMNSSKAAPRRSVVRRTIRANAAAQNALTLPGMRSCLAAVLLLGCTRNAPPTPDVDARVAPLPAATVPVPSVAPVASSSVVAPRDGGDPGALPQTRDKPPASSDALEERARALWDGIAQDDPDRAMPFFFPVSAYEQVKAIPSPASDWRRRLVAAFKRDVHALAKRLGDAASSASFVRLEVPDERARWVEPNEESNKIGYYRVYGTRLVYAVDGKERAFDISSLISWRGEWYVVHLTGFK